MSAELQSLRTQQAQSYLSFQAMEHQNQVSLCFYADCCFQLIWLFTFTRHLPHTRPSADAHIPSLRLPW